MKTNQQKIKNILIISTILFFLIQPILDLDYLLLDFYKSIGFLAPSTIVNFLGVGVLFVAVWYFFDEHKKRTFFITIGFILVICLYFVFHYFTSTKINVFFPSSFQWSSIIEIKYIITLIIPLFVIYIVRQLKLTKEEFNTIILFISAFISIMIVLTNLLVVSNGSYGNIIYGNIINWFTNVNDFIPRELTSIGFFKAANQMSALLFMTFPFLYKIVFEEKKWFSTCVLFLQLFSMFMIGTRVAAYGTIMISAIVLVVYLYCFFIKKVAMDKFYILKIVLALIISISILPFTPAYRNSAYDYRDDPNFLQNEQRKSELLKEIEGLDEEEYRYALIFLFETQFVYFLTFPREYYEYYYSYKLDPEFWLMIFETPFEQRMNGRQIQEIFMNYKYKDLSFIEKLSGLGYSRLSNGGIVLEQDFSRQYYALGLIGMVLCTFPYLILLLYCGLKALWKFKLKMEYELIILFAGLIGVIGVAYYSGHVLDELIVSLFIALTFGYVLTKIGKDSHE